MDEIISRDKEFYYLVTRVLADYQTIEFLLRKYIKSCYECTRKALGKKLNYKRPLSKLEKMSLGSLIDEAKVYSSNADFMKALKESVRFRNEVAHSILSDMHQSGFDDISMIEKVSELRRRKVHLEHLINFLFEELYGLK